VAGVLLRATAGPLFLGFLAATMLLALAAPGRSAAGIGVGCLLAGFGVARLARRP
jgi:hypothetical protein